MAEQLAEQSTLQQVVDQLRVSNELITGHSVKTERIFTETEKQTDSVTGAVKDTKDAVKDGSDIVSGAVSKAGDISNKTAQALQKAQMGVWNGIKASLGFTGKTLSGMAKITGLQWALAKREGKASRLMEFGKAALKPITGALSSGISTLKDFLGTLAKLGMFLAAGGLLELFTNEKWQEWLKNMWNTMIEKVKKWWTETDFKALFDEFKVKFEKWYKENVQHEINDLIKNYENIFSNTSKHSYSVFFGATSSAIEALENGSNVIHIVDNATFETYSSKLWPSINVHMINKNIFRYTLKTKNKCITFGNRQRNFNLPNFLPKV